MDIYAMGLIAVFVGVLVVTLTEKADKTVISLLGAIATLTLLSMRLNVPLIDGLKYVISHYVDFPTLIIMFSVLIIGEVIGEAGVFQWLSIKLVKVTKGDPKKIMLLLVILTIVLSAFLTIVAAAVIMSRLTVTISKALDVDSRPFLITEAVSISIGGLTSLIASPASILISQEENLTFVFFVITTMPFAVVMAVIVSLILLKIVKIPNEVPADRKQVLMEFDEWSVVPSRALFYLTIVIIIGMTIGFFIYPAFIVAFTGATLFLLIRQLPFNKVAEKIEWSDILFFIGIFTIVGGVEETGVLEEIGHLLAEISAGNVIIPLLLILWVSGIASGFLDEVTIALTFLPIIRELVATGGFQLYKIAFITALILSTNLGGCLTPIGTPANLIILSTAKKEGKIVSFSEFIRLGAIIVLINLVAASLYIGALVLFV